MSKGSGPSVWLFPTLGAVVAVAPVVNNALGYPISNQMNAMMFIVGVALPLVSILYLFDKPAAHERVAIGLSWCLAVPILLSVEWGHLDSYLWVVAVFFLIPTFVRIAGRA